MPTNQGNKNTGNQAGDRDKATDAGRKSGPSGGANVAHDREKASESGQKGGKGGKH